MNSSGKNRISFELSLTLESGATVELTATGLTAQQEIDLVALEAAAALLGLATPEQMREHDRSLSEREAHLRLREEDLRSALRRRAAVSAQPITAAAHEPRVEASAVEVGQGAVPPASASQEGSESESDRGEWVAQLVDIIESGLEVAALDGNDELSISMQTLCEMLLDDFESVSTPVRAEIGVALRAAVASRPEWSVVRRTPSRAERETGDSSSRYHVYQRSTAGATQQRRTPGVR